MADKDSDVKYLTAQICLLTTALRGHREDDPVQSVKLRDSVILTLYHVATLLTTGTPSYVTGPASDPKALRVVAVTANVDSTAVQCILVAQNTRNGMSPRAAQVRPLLSTELTANKEEEVDKILATWDVNVVSQDPEVHYRNIFTIIDSFRTPSTDKDRLSRTIDQFQLYMVANAYPKIAARILNGGNTWETHPIETLATYDLSQIHIPPDKTLLVKRREIFNWLTMDRGITAEHPTFESGGTAFRITRHNIRPWVDALTETYIGLKNALIENGVCKEKLGGDEIITATMMLTQFHGLLETGLVEFLLEDKPLFKAMGKKKTNANYRSQDRTEDTTVNTEETSLLAVEEEDVLSQDFERPSTSEDPIFRYLKTIVAWYEAATSIFRRPPRIPISANLVALPDPVIDNVEDCIKTFLDELSQHPLVETKNFPGYLDRRKLAERVQGVTYHAEAILMGLAHSFSPSEVELPSQRALGLNHADWDILKRVFKTQWTPIAVSKKCCWCCWRLYQYWHPTDPSRTPPPPKDTSDASPELFLSGSHSIIYPWCPPPLAGIPTEFLRRLRNDLLEVLVRAMKRSKVQHKSGQTSAHSSGAHSDLVRDIEAQHPRRFANYRKDDSAPQP